MSLRGRMHSHFIASIYRFQLSEGEGREAGFRNSGDPDSRSDGDSRLLTDRVTQELLCGWRHCDSPSIDV